MPVARGVTALFVVVLALGLAPSAGAAPTTTAPTAPVFDAHGRLVGTPFVPSAGSPRLARERVLAIFEANHKVAAWLTRYPATGRIDEETYTAKDGSWTVKIWWGSAGEIAEGRVDDTSGVVLEAWTGPQVAWKMARGYPGAFGGTTDQQPVALGRVLPRLPDRARRPAPAAFDPQPRPADAAVADDLAVVLQPRQRLRRGAALLSDARVGRRARRLDRRHRPRHAHARGLAGVGAARGDGLPRRLPHRPQLSGVERDRRRLLRRDRRRADRPRPGAVGALPGRGQPQGMRSGRLERRDPRADPGQRTLRVGEPAGRHLRAGRVRGVHPGRADPSVEGALGHAAGGAHHRRRVRPALHPRALAHRPALRRNPARGDARVRMGGVSVHAVRLQLEHERCDHARAS